MDGLEMAACDLLRDVDVLLEDAFDIRIQVGADVVRSRLERAALKIEDLDDLVEGLEVRLAKKPDAFLRASIDALGDFRSYSPPVGI